MANTPSLNGINGLTFVRSAGLMLVTVTVSDTYASASGGITVDLATVMTNPPTGITYANNCAPFAFGFTTLGYTAIATKTGTASTYTVKLWNGTTQFSDGAITATLYLFVPLF